jgi:hypothetical protein
MKIFRGLTKDEKKIVEKITDCGPNGGCEDCDVCEYYRFLSLSDSLGFGSIEGFAMTRDKIMERYLDIRGYKY